MSLYIAQLGKENARFSDKKVSRDFTMVQINYVGTTSFFQAPMYSYKKIPIQRLLAVREAFEINCVAVYSTAVKKKIILPKTKSISNVQMIRWHHQQCQRLPNFVY